MASLAARSDDEGRLRSPIAVVKEGVTGSFSIFRGSTPLHLKRERLAEIDTLHFRVARQRFRTAVAEDTGVIDDLGAARDHQGFAHVVVPHQDPDPGTLEIENDPLQFQRLNRIDA